MASEEEFLDILYLGIFVTLSPAFDGRFYLDSNPPTAISEEIAYAVGHFHSLLLTFSLRFIILLDGEPVEHTYVVDRMMAEFSAASVGFALVAFEQQSINAGNFKGPDDITGPAFAARVEELLKESFPNAFDYYSRCLHRRHKDFLWSGPTVQILPRSEEIESIIRLATEGETLDSRTQPIYPIDLDPMPTTPPSNNRKRRDPEDGMDLDDPPSKRARQS